jgi:putative membrane fusion protein
MSKRKRKIIRKILLYIFLLTVLILAGIIYLYPVVSGAFAHTSLAQYGNLRVAAVETCYIIRKEKVVTATSSGSIKYYLDEGELVRKGTKAADVFPQGNDYIVDENSMVSYFIDGLEEVFTPEGMNNLKKEDMSSLVIEISDVKRESVIAGEPIYKLVDNNSWYVALWPEPDDAIKYQKGKAIYINLPLGQVKGTIYDIIDSNNSLLVLLRFTRHYEEMQKIRTVEAEVITQDYEGLLIANGSITTQDGKTGVYIKGIGGDFIFRPVLVIASDGEYSLVENSYFYEKDGDKSVRIKTVDAYDEILNYPEKRKND